MLGNYRLNTRETRTSRVPPSHSRATNQSSEQAPSLGRRTCRGRRFVVTPRDVPTVPSMASKKVCCLLGNPGKLCLTRAPIVTSALRGNASWEPVDKVTHTGQKYDPDDKRLMRFVDRQKEVNTNWAIDLIAEVPPTATKKRVIACDGGGGPLGHPKVYINVDKPGNHSCGYCGLRFYKEDHHH